MFDYTTVSAQSVTDVVEEAIAEGEAIIERITTGPASWDSVMVPLDSINRLTTRAYGEGPFMARVHTDKAVRDAAQQAEERLSKWVSDLVFRRPLYEAVEAFAASDEATALDDEAARFLEHTRRDFRRAGHALSGAERDEVQKIRTRLVELEVAFNRNIDEVDDGIEMTREQLAGLPDDYVGRLSPGSAEGTYRVSLDYPDYYPFMDLAEDRDLRRGLQFRFYNKATEENRPLLEEAVALRKRMAEIFGLPSWADYAMEIKMAKRPKVVDEMYAGIRPGLEAGAAEELADLREALGSDDLQGWDHRFLHTAIKKERHGVDQTEVAAYFPLQNVLDGMFDITGEVLGLAYEPIEDPRAWHPDVTAYRLLDRDSGEHLATFYMDLHPREGKFGHAAAFDLVTVDPEAGVTPVTSIVANVTKPSKDSPSLLKHDEVVTMFHEFGHVLHNSLGRSRFARFAGFNTEWDFVEAPSQIMEHWCWRPEALQRFARHHETGEPIPEDLVEKLVAARNLHIALFMLRQVSFGLLDLALHGPSETKDLDAITRQTSEIGGFPFHEGTFYPASFGHLFGYDAGYYGYLWAKVYGDDMFSVFEEEGVLSPTVGKRYRERVLAAGGTRDAEDTLRDFLGREPNNEAFLRYLGIEG